MKDLLAKIDQAAAAGRLLESSAANIRDFLGTDPPPVALASVAELAGDGNWAELDNRFFQTLAFGTGGLRGKSIGVKVTDAERGVPQPLGRPEHPCTGTNAMNSYSISRATQGLVAYVREFFERAGLEGRPSICICHDTRFFSREFAGMAARIITDLGCDALLFEGPRSTPQLSFAIRHTNSQAGINITASHNPPEYNGYKVYFDDGGQVVDPHAEKIIARVNAIAGERYEAVPEDRRGRLIPLGRQMDEDYMARLGTLPLEPSLFGEGSGLKAVYTPLHGVGAAIIKPMLERLGVDLQTVPEQEIPDGRFPTVRSPNPENPEALAMAVALADKTGADLVIATDPDDDRMGIAARDASGTMVLLTGNQIGSILCWHRVTRHFALGILDDSNKDRAVVIKTFVTSDLQKEIATRHGIRCVETLTGFKYIGAKLRKYEEAIPEPLRRDYRRLSEEETRRLRLQYSSLYIFGGEESYGYSASDFVRDKDGNSAAVLIAEAAAFARSKGMTLVGLLDEIYAEYGFYFERGESLVMDGAEGAARIRSLVASYADHPPEVVDGARVVSRLDFAREEIHDIEGDLIPSEAMMIFTLDDGRRAAIRPSGTEPKIKYYLFGHRSPPECARFSPDDLASAKDGVTTGIDRLWRALKNDAEARLA
jgi:phosphoglucomutase